MAAVADEEGLQWCECDQRPNLVRCEQASSSACNSVGRELARAQEEAWAAAQGLCRRRFGQAWHCSQPSDRSQPKSRSCDR
eukprot:2953517-Prymnesium_polylepis.1